MNVENKLITPISRCKSSKMLVGWTHRMIHIIIIAGIKFMGVSSYAEEGYNNIDWYALSLSLIRRGQIL